MVWVSPPNKLPHCMHKLKQVSLLELLASVLRCFVKTERLYQEQQAKAGSMIFLTGMFF